MEVLSLQKVLNMHSVSVHILLSIHAQQQETQSSKPLMISTQMMVSLKSQAHILLSVKMTTIRVQPPWYGHRKHILLVKVLMHLYINTPKTTSHSKNFHQQRPSWTLRAIHAHSRCIRSLRWNGMLRIMTVPWISATSIISWIKLVSSNPLHTYQILKLAQTARQNHQMLLFARIIERNEVKNETSFRINKVI